MKIKREKKREIKDALCKTHPRRLDTAQRNSQPAFPVSVHLTSKSAKRHNSSLRFVERLLNACNITSRW